MVLLVLNYSFLAILRTFLVKKQSNISIIDPSFYSTVLKVQGLDFSITVIIFFLNERQLQKAS